jgi:glycosyltransferase involved in cell wall biosynthesis
MRVALHSDNFARRTRFGLSRYSHEIHGGLAAHGVETVPVSSVSDFGDEQPDWLTKSGFRQLPLSRRVLATLWATGSPMPRLERWVDEVDIVHSLDVDYPIATAKPWIVTYHDLGVLVHPQYFGKAKPWLLRSSISAAARRAAAIICVSRATADEVMEFGGAGASDRIHVIEEGVGDEFFVAPNAEALAELPASLAEHPFFLFTGSLSPRKNLARVVAAFASVADRIPHRLVLTGARGWDTAEDIKAISEKGLADRVVELGYVSDAVLKALYARATAFLYPSLYEGFGLPILEAMASGCPVVTSNIAPMTEVGGDAAVYVDPHYSHDLAAAILRLANDETLRIDRSDQGRVQARRLNWQTCVRRTVEVYRQVAQERRHAPR